MSPATRPALATPEQGYTEPQFVDVAGTPTAYRRSGSGVPVVYLHGHWATRRWLPFHEALARSVDLIAPEHPGFGESGPLPPAATSDDVVLHYRDFLDAVVGAPAHLVGYGLGAWFAADVATWFPERVASLTVIAPFGLRIPGQPIADIFLMNPADLMAAYYHGDPTPYADLVPGVGSPQQGGAEEFAQRYGELGSAAALIWNMRYDLKLERRLTRLEMPALVVTAGEDKIVPVGHGERWAELLSAKQVTIPDAGHAVVVEQPTAVADAIVELASEVASR